MGSRRAVKPDCNPCSAPHTQTYTPLSSTPAVCCGVQTSSENCGTAPALGGVPVSHSHFLDGDIMAPHAWETNPFHIYTANLACSSVRQGCREKSSGSRFSLSIAVVTWSNNNFMQHCLRETGALRRNFSASSPYILWVIKLGDTGPDGLWAVDVCIC